MYSKAIYYLVVVVVVVDVPLFGDVNVKKLQVETPSTEEDTPQLLRYELHDPLLTFGLCTTSITILVLYKSLPEKSNWLVLWWYV